MLNVHSCRHRDTKIGINTNCSTLSATSQIYWSQPSFCFNSQMSLIQCHSKASSSSSAKPNTLTHYSLSYTCTPLTFMLLLTPGEHTHTHILGQTQELLTENKREIQASSTTATGHQCAPSHIWSKRQQQGQNILSLGIQCEFGNLLFCQWDALLCNFPFSVSSIFYISQSSLVPALIPFQKETGIFSSKSPYTSYVWSILKYVMTATLFLGRPFVSIEY